MLGSQHQEHESNGSCAPDERRDEGRIALLIRSAKLVCDIGELLCVIRDVSASGVKLRLFHPLPPGDRYELELANGERFEIFKVWEEEGQAGFRFEKAVDLGHIVAEESQFPKRPVRLKLDADAIICVAGQSCAATILDLSREGVRVQTSVPLAISQKLRIWADDLPELDAIVRWRRKPEFGLVLPRVMSFEELALTAARIQFPAEMFRSAGTEG